MPVPAPNLYPDFNTIRLSHVCLNVKDLTASKEFYTNILGLQVTDESTAMSTFARWKNAVITASFCKNQTSPARLKSWAFKTLMRRIWTSAEVYFQRQRPPNLMG